MLSRKSQSKKITYDSVYMKNPDRQIYAGKSRLVVAKRWGPWVGGDEE